MQATFYWTAYTLQVLAVSTARAHGEHKLADEYDATAREYLDKHFEEVEKCVDRIGAHNG
jgi:hypothetical protein